MIAALFVATGGAYYGLPGVDPWDAERDARKYAGGFHSQAERETAGGSRARRLTAAENAATPPAFRDLLLSKARGAR